jgi:transcriptional regulator with XRE-family HTH domain
MGILASLIQIRRMKSVFQKDLLSDLGVTATTLSRYESGKRKMPHDMLEKYADSLGYELRLMLKK